MTPIEAPPTVDPVAARRWAQRPPAPAPWLHEEVARRMAERLTDIRLPVDAWADWAPTRGGQDGHAAVAGHYPDAKCFMVRSGANAGLDAIKNESSGWWRRLLGGRAAAPAWVAEPPPGALQLVWANMLAHQVADPAALLAAWHRALAVDGFVMFSCFGPDTLRELRAVYARLGWPPPAQAFTDMHDWGDQLVAAGFADPVMDMERITLTFDSAPRLLAELRELGRNQHRERFPGLRTPAWRTALLAALQAQLRPAGGGPLGLTFEVIYGHALRPPPRHRVAATSAIPLDELKASLRQRSQRPEWP